MWTRRPLKVIGALCSLALLAVATGSSADAPKHAVQSPRGVRVLCDNGSRFGSAVLLHDFRPGHKDDLLLVTALHVLLGCAQIEPVIVDCSVQQQRVLSTPWSAAHPVDLLTWKAYDLVAVVVPAAERAALLRQLNAITLAPDDAQVEPAFDSRLLLVAKSGINVCPRIPARVRDVMTVAELYDSLGLPDYYALFGSLSSRTRIMSYESTAVGGASGGPVLLLDDAERALIAVHLGGQASILQWGLLVASNLLNDELERAGASALGRLDSAQPVISSNGFAAPLQLTQPNDDLNAQADVATRRNGLLAMFEASTPVDPFGAVSNSLQLGWTHQWLSLPKLGFVSLGTRVIAAGMSGIYRSPVFAGPYSEAKLSGTAKLPFIGAFAELDAEMSFARMSPWNYVIGLGLRAGLSHLPDVEGRATHVTWGPVLYGSLRWRLNERWTGLAQLHFTVTRIPADKTPLDCIGPSVPGPETWDVWGGLSLGTEFTP